ncbi:hypothetical protein QT196_19525 [Streptomyces sp. P9-2B-2]|uniref:hypothetical protein n=1 Tax=Streptomyces TaxID=1883 RepID=UPI002253576A|nr:MULTISPECIES: hypothetical protein [Streptomyces]MCX4639295.1 hypothetical protein [Streptomyces platensis]WJY39289.1 hypothetical protein QT196_19525 [Streptomyces sp. P9-2B-2]
MRTRLAAGVVGAAALLTLLGGNVAAADGKDHVAQATDTPGQAHDSSPWMHDTPLRTNDRPGRLHDRREGRYDRREGRYERPGRFRDNPLRLTTCALGTALGSLTGSSEDCLGGRSSRGDRD